MGIDSLVTIALCALAVTGAAVAILTREVLRFGLGVGLFLIALAGLFAVRGFDLLAVGELFLYVGGVLVLLMFALLLVHRGGTGDRRLTSRHDPVAAVASVGVGAAVFLLARPFVAERGATWRIRDVADLLLDKMMVEFELAGLLLLAALVAVVIVSGEGER